MPAVLLERLGTWPPRPFLPSRTRARPRRRRPWGPSGCYGVLETINPGLTSPADRSGSWLVRYFDVLCRTTPLVHASWARFV